MERGLAIAGGVVAKGPSGTLEIRGEGKRLVVDLPRLRDGFHLLTAGHQSGRRVRTGASRLGLLVSLLRRAALRLELRLRGRAVVSLGAGSLPVAVHVPGLVRATFRG